jgi:transcriptional regulator of acetoin/glycerol metabolism
VIERGLIVSDGPVLELDDDLQSSVARRGEEFPWPGSAQTEAAGVHGEAQRLLKSLELSGGNHSQAAKALGIGRTTLWRKLKFHGLACFLVSALGEDLLLQVGVVLSLCA